MANSTISSLNSITTPSSAALLWISDPNASPIDRSWSIANALSTLISRKRAQVVTSGTLGTLTVLWDTDYIITATSTVTLPAGALTGARLTFKTMGAYGITITAYSGHYIGDGGATAANSTVVYGKGGWITLEWDGTNTIWHVVGSGVSKQSVSGALGQIAQITDSFFEFTATGSLTLPLYPEEGCVYTIKNKTAATVTINASTVTVVQTIGTTTSTSFVLYAAEDYVVLRYSISDLTWYVVATNGPVLSSSQTATTLASTTNAWTAIGNGLSLGTLAPGVYDLELDVSMTSASADAILTAAIGNGTTPISYRAATYIGASSGSPVHWVLGHCFVAGYVLSAAATIQGIYYVTASGNSFQFDSTQAIGRITARRIG